VPDRALSGDRFLKLKNATRLLGGYTLMVANWLPVSLDGQDWETAADIWAERHRVGKPIQDADLLIAVTALKADAILVTNNTRHFEGLGLLLENWASTGSE
jgi:tRNA(fMet)-specific endonuclease VapC